jgi:predicted dehydrogenase
VRSGERLKLLVCGAGRVAELYYAPALRHSADFQVQAVVEVSEARRAWAAEAFDVPVYASAVEAIGIEAPDAGLVLVPPGAQREIATELVQRGVAVLMEKPGVRSGPEARKLLEVARGVPVRLALARRYWRRYRDLGKRLRTVPDRWSVEIETDPRAWGTYSAPPAGIEGVIDDLLPHAFDIATHVLGVEAGEPESASGADAGLSLDFGGPGPGRISVRHGSKWQETVRCRSGSSAWEIRSDRWLVSRAIERASVSLRLRRAEPIEAIERLLADFAREVRAGVTNDDLIRWALLRDEIGRLLGQRDVQGQA